LFEPEQPPPPAEPPQPPANLTEELDLTPITPEQPILIEEPPVEPPVIEIQEEVPKPQIAKEFDIMNSMSVLIGNSDTS
jgi:hypothetical protein